MSHQPGGDVRLSYKLVKNRNVQCRIGNKMSPSQLSLSIVVPLLGIMVLVAYYVCFTKLQSPAPYHLHSMWFDMPMSYRYLCIVFQVMAIVGFLLFCVYYVQQDAARGLFTYLDGHMTTILVATFLLASIAWPIFTTVHMPNLSVTSLVVAAMACMLLLAGAVEDRVPIHIIISIMVLCIVVVLQDGVMWNANYIIGL